MARGSSASLGLQLQLQGFPVAAVAVAALLVVAAAPTRCAAQASGCTASILSLAPCLSFTAGSTSSPGASCCSALAGVVRGAPRCLCAVLGGGAAASFGVTVNATRALELPGKCKVTTPPVSQCNAVGAPASSPPSPPPVAAAPGTGSTSPSAPAAAAEAPIAPPPVYSTTGAGSKATPATGAVSSDAVAAKSAAAVSFTVAIAFLMAL